MYQDIPRSLLFSSFQAPILAEFLLRFPDCGDKSSNAFRKGQGLHPQLKSSRIVGAFLLDVDSRLVAQTPSALTQVLAPCGVQTQRCAFGPGAAFDSVSWAAQLT
jgi:hypothetical protein